MWLTQTGNPGDHLIQAGEAFPIERPGLVLISALEDSVYAVSGGKSNLPGFNWLYLAFWRIVRRFEAARKSLLA